VTIAQGNYQNLHSLALTKRRSTDIMPPSCVGLALMRFALATTSS
jgi:hypothetical protein